MNSVIFIFNTRCFCLFLFYFVCIYFFLNQNFALILLLLHLDYLGLSFVNINISKCPEVAFHSFPIIVSTWQDISKTKC